MQYRVEQTSCVLGLCVSCAQALRLNSMAATRQLCQTDSEINQLRQAFWLLYCIEKAFRMRSGQFPVSLCYRLFWRSGDCDEVHMYFLTSWTCSQ